MSNVMRKKAPRRTGRACATLLALASLLALTACSSPDNPTASLADYNARLSRVLEAELPPAAATRVPTWPSSADITLQPTDVRVGMFTFLDFGRCGLLREISERNSGLGRVQAPSQRLLYEMRLLRGLRHCSELTAGELASDDPAAREFAKTVRQILELKTRDLPLVYWNATFAAAELREFFSVSALPLRRNETGAAGDAANALAWLAALGRLSPDAPLPASEAMEQNYYQLVGTRRGGRTWLSLDLASRELDRGTYLLQRAAAAGKLCPGGAPTMRAQRLRNVFTEIYVARVQPWLSAIAGDSRVLGDALEQLWQAQQVTAPPAVARYREAVWAEAPGSVREDFSNAVRNHALAWKGVLAPCGFAPAAPAASR
jgi:hypothetical protein